MVETIGRPGGDEHRDDLEDEVFKRTIEDEDERLNPSVITGWPGRGWRLIRSNRLTTAGIVIVAVVLLDTLLAPLIAPYDPQQTDPTATLQPPSLAHPFGTDVSGFDVLSRVMYAPRIDITIAVSATVLSILVGASLGVISGYSGKIAGEGIVRVSDIVQSFPLFILAMALVALTGQQVSNLIYALAFLNAPIYLRLMRSQTLGIRRRAYVEASETAGNTTFTTIRRHVLPNALTPIFVQASVTIGWSILLVAGLSFVGAGVRAPTPEWGLMVSDAAPNVITGQWWPSVFPGAAIALSVLGFSLLGVGLQQAYERGRL
jgi:peptide/nickel transport system permease protein